MSYSSPQSAGQPRPRQPVGQNPGPKPKPTLPEPTPDPRPKPTLPEPTGPNPTLPEPNPGPGPNPTLPEPTPGPGPKPTEPKPTPGQPNDATGKIPIGYSGIISGLSRSYRTQNAVVTISAADGRKIFQSVLVGSGENKPMTEEIDPNSTGIAFGPLNYEANVIVSIKNASLGGRDFRPSTVIAPITVAKEPFGCSS
ncbi:hypothetical protein GALMADRAFT_254573 [Galerina marginata CBS 339.88]|uniref:Uncharacterized protein n=1 Tax=Galerina marginata (strain CBS 339.88) TaxID=685588 RepID=A0A067STG4_GALM3|nr:hypothetical protein GALMADRAFT_254573 [Galerina marginata CBS 339.88]